jgi:regulator of sirC expression with transglutaminase-like and TPR domain
VEATQQFAELMARNERDVPLDEAVLLVARHAHPGLVVTDELGRLDDLADRCREPTLDGLRRLLFVDEGFCGNVADYYDPRNSYLNEVIDRRTGIPISLATVMLVVGRRVGVPLVGVGMPGHFLLRDRVDPSVFIDPFARGMVLDMDGCRGLFQAVHGSDDAFTPTLVAPVGTFDIVGRTLANLRMIFSRINDRVSLAWVLGLRCAVPGVGPEARAELAGVLASLGRFAQAAEQLEVLACSVDDERAQGYRKSADRLRARLN